MPRIVAKQGKRSGRGLCLEVPHLNTKGKEEGCRWPPSPPPPPKGDGPCDRQSDDDYFTWQLRHMVLPLMEARRKALPDGS